MAQAGSTLRPRNSPMPRSGLVLWRAPAGPDLRHQWERAFREPRRWITSTR